MPHIKYKEWNPTHRSQELVVNAHDILNEYEQQGYRLSLRQLYYQFVSRDLIANNQKSYNRLGGVISRARDAGMIDWNQIQDRGRNLSGRNTYASPQSFLRRMSSRFCSDYWEGQSVRCQVWIEKDALSNVASRACSPLDVNYFPCKGYMSASAIWKMGRMMLQSDCNRWVVLHLGDHDPSGIDMTRDIRERLQMYSQPTKSDNYNGFERPYIEVRRIALNMDQIDRYGPPPNPAKLSDSRAKDYIAEYGTSSWELDALEPSVIVDLITEHVEALISDRELFDSRKTFERESRTKIRNLSV